MTLTLMVLLSILALGILSLSTVALRSSGNSDNNQIARANAPRPGGTPSLPGPGCADERPRGNTGERYQGRRQRLPEHAGGWWAGVSHSDGVTKFSPSGKDVQWLVSGLSGGNIGGGLSNPVKMIGAGSLDLATLTSGKDIKAGRVPVKNDKGKIYGSYAWFVDDNGMKAQLRPADPKIQNSNPANPSGGVLAASYDPSILTDLGSLNPTTQQLRKTGRNTDLEFVGRTRPVIRSKYTERHHKL